MENLKNKTFVMNNYQKKKTFANFLSGIAGEIGKPLWSFYVNRGQLITSFGMRDKNGAIMEFYPANLAYMYVSTIGFRTFIKIDGEVRELFLETGTSQKLLIDPHQVAIEEVIEELSIKIKVTYFLLPNDSIAGLVRKVELFNLSNEERDIQIIDGMPQILPAGIDYGGYKAVSNLLQSWMITSDEKEFLFYKLSSSTEDTEEVKKVEDGNFYFTRTNDFEKTKYIYDYKLVFENDYSFKTPYGMNNENIFETDQAYTNQVPAAMTLFKGQLKEKAAFISVIGYANNKDTLISKVKDLNFDILNNKEKENLNNHQKILSDINVETAYPMFDNYLKQSYLDNLMRGGRPLPVITKDGPGSYHLYSRKHGDLERDYNFFSTEPSYYSQGNGNFRDVLQNRRNDILFFPEIEDFNVYHFASLIQADGYNPLSIEGVKFKFEGDINKFDKLKDILIKPFTVGTLVEEIYNNNMVVKTTLDEIIAMSKIEIIAVYGEGYWQDHFTYLYDVIETYLAVYPDKINDFLYKNIKYPFFVSPVEIRKRKDKYVLNKQGNVRQYHAIKHVDNIKHSWLEDESGKKIEVNLIGKLMTLIANKFATLDQAGIGLMYEAGKPGWNDAMNGLPGVFGSGVGETIELLKIVKFVKKHYDINENIYLLKSTKEFINKLVKDVSWDYRVTQLESYRDELKKPQQTIKVKAEEFFEALNIFENVLKEGLEKAQKISPIFPTYLTYEAINYNILDEIGEHGLQLVDVKEFKIKPIANFLEAPARALALIDDTNESKRIYDTIKQTELYDEKFKFYKTSVSLENESEEIGRIKGFSPGWLERESNFLHMTYKYILGLIKAGLYDEFYKEIKNNITAFMDPEVYGRNPLENSTFIVPSNGLDKTKHGQGFFARLSGSNAEVLSMWRYMFIGKEIFKYENNELVFELSPKLHKDFFKNKVVKTTLFRNLEIIYINEDNVDTYEGNINKIEVITKEQEYKILGSKIKGELALAVREGKVNKIKVYIKGGSK